MRLWGPLLVLCGLTAPALGGVRMDARTHGSVLVLTFTNTGEKPIELERRFPGPVPMYDALTVGVAGRGLSFTLPRRATPPPEVARIPAGGSFTESVDLQPWAVRAGGPFPAGTHAVTVRWDATHSSSGEHFVTTAKTTVV
ncbi:MAG: hypothetical protein KIT31_10450, partial [Deltaproteobacteria bacterium]|nr:hypothetical protein [Deltaproteobacteria bacterium]